MIPASTMKALRVLEVEGRQVPEIQVSSIPASTIKALRVLEAERSQVTGIQVSLTLASMIKASRALAVGGNPLVETLRIRLRQGKHQENQGTAERKQRKKCQVTFHLLLIWINTSLFFSMLKINVQRNS